MGDYCYTTSHEVVAQWRRIREVQYGVYQGGPLHSAIVWYYGWRFDAMVAQWRIPTSALPEVYGFRVGQPWATIQGKGRYAFIACGSFDIITGAAQEPTLHKRAVMACDSAGSLRALWEVIEEVRNA
jgi:hypothetical protein